MRNAEIHELQKAHLAATGEVKTAKRKKDGTISSKTADARETTFQLLKAEVDAGYVHPVPRPTPADHKTAAESYQEADDTLKWLQDNKDKVQRLIAERSSWRGALCAAMNAVPGAFSIEFCQRQIKRISDAIIKTRNALLLRDLHL